MRIEGPRFYDALSELGGFALMGNGVHAGPIAPVERGPSEGARSGSTGPAWMSFPIIFLRARRAPGCSSPLSHLRQFRKVMREGFHAA